MKDDLKKELKVIFEDLKLDDASIDKIVQLFNENVEAKANARVEIALQEQDNTYSEKLKLFLEKLDTKHADKMKQIVEACENKYIKKLNLLKEAYDNKYKKQFIKFKDDIVNTNQTFINMYLNKLVPQKIVNESVIAKKNEKLINEMKKMLAISGATEREAIKDGIIQARKTIVESANEVNRLKSENRKLLNQINKQKRDTLLENKLAKVSPEKRDTLRKIFADKSIQQINEGFEYSSKLLSNRIKKVKQQKYQEILQEKSKNGDLITHPVIENQNVVNESINNYNNNATLTSMDDYVAELIG